MKRLFIVDNRPRIAAMHKAIDGAKLHQDAKQVRWEMEPHTKRLGISMATTWSVARMALIRPDLAHKVVDKTSKWNLRLWLRVPVRIVLLPFLALAWLFDVLTQR